MNLKELREKYKLTQAGFAEPLGVSGKSIYLIESGRMKLSKKLSDKIAEVYGEVIEPAERKEGTRAGGVKADKSAAEAAVKAVAAPREVKEKKTRKRAAKKEMVLVIQSPFGGEITPEEIRSRIGEADTVYIRADHNKAYWVRGDETGSIDLW